MLGGRKRKRWRRREEGKEKMSDDRRESFIKEEENEKREKRAIFEGKMIWRERRRGEWDERVFFLGEEDRGGRLLGKVLESLEGTAEERERRKSLEE